MRSRTQQNSVAICFQTAFPQTLRVRARLQATARLFIPGVGSDGAGFLVNQRPKGAALAPDLTRVTTAITGGGGRRARHPQGPEGSRQAAACAPKCRAQGCRAGRRWRSAGWIERRRRTDRTATCTGRKARRDPARDATFWLPKTQGINRISAHKTITLRIELSRNAHTILYPFVLHKALWRINEELLGWLSSETRGESVRNRGAFCQTGVRGEGRGASRITSFWPGRVPLCPSLQGPGRSHACDRSQGLCPATPFLTGETSGLPCAKKNQTANCIDQWLWRMTATTTPCTRH